MDSKNPTILFTWECGGGLGHLMQIRPLAEGLARRGARIFAAVRDSSRAGSVFDRDAITLLPAPFKAAAPAAPFKCPATFAHVLHNVGWDDDTGLGGMVDAWRALFELVRPGVIVFDHSPTALLASRGMALRRIVIGSGFCCPPDTSPPPSLRPSRPADPGIVATDEAAVLERANRVLAKRRWPLLERIGQLYSQVDESFLLTFRELDHYVDRPGGPRYRGAWTDAAGKRPRWPLGSGKRIYAYLKPFPALPHLLVRLKGLACPTLVFGDRIDRQTRDQFACSTMRFESEPLDLKAVAGECDVAVLHGGHGTTASLLLAGKPILLLPLVLEQQMLAARVCRLGAGLEAPIDKPVEIVRQLECLLDDAPIADSARAFAGAHRDFDPLAENDRMVSCIERLA